MDRKDRFWIVAAATVAVMSVALSAFIVLFAPEDPYLPATKGAAMRSIAPPSARAPNRDGKAPARTDGGASGTDASLPESDPRIAYAAGAASAGIALMFAAIGWRERMAAMREAEACRVATLEVLADESPKAVVSAGPAACTHRDDDGRIGGVVAALALGLGAFVPRSRSAPCITCRPARAPRGRGARSPATPTV